MPVCEKAGAVAGSRPGAHLLWSTQERTANGSSHAHTAPTRTWASQSSTWSSSMCSCSIRSRGRSSRGVLADERRQADGMQAPCRAVRLVEADTGVQSRRRRRSSGGSGATTAAVAAAAAPLASPAPAPAQPSSASRAPPPPAAAAPGRAASGASPARQAAGDKQTRVAPSSGSTHARAEMGAGWRRGRLHQAASRWRRTGSAKRRSPFSRPWASRGAAQRSTAHPQGPKVWGRHVLEPVQLVCRGGASKHGQTDVSRAAGQRKAGAAEPLQLGGLRRGGHAEASRRNVAVVTGGSSPPPSGCTLRGGAAAATAHLRGAARAAAV